MIYTLWFVPLFLYHDQHINKIFEIDFSFYDQKQWSNAIGCWNKSNKSQLLPLINDKCKQLIIRIDKTSSIYQIINVFKRFEALPVTKWIDECQNEAICNHMIVYLVYICIISRFNEQYVSSRTIYILLWHSCYILIEINIQHNHPFCLHNITQTGSNKLVYKIVT